MKPEINLNVIAEDGELVIREGQALPVKEPQAVKLSGILDSPLRWLQQRIDYVDQKAAYVLVNREALTIKLVTDEANFYQDTITGSLLIHPMFKKFGINSEKFITNFEMANLIKMNRTVFESKQEAMGLVTTLQNFKAKVEREIEKANDNRGNAKQLRAQTVQSNLPESFNIIMPIFIGTEPQTFTCEVHIDPDDYSCTLSSPEANDLVEFMRDHEINKILEGIKQVAPGIVIIEQ